jgi:hypothetical protein
MEDSTGEEDPVIDGDGDGDGERRVVFKMETVSYGIEDTVELS